MGRYRKPFSDYLRAGAAAASLADLVGVERSGYALAAWYESARNLPKGSVDEKSWRRFLSGHQPQQERMSRICEMVPSIAAFQEHPFWGVARSTCTKAIAVATLDSYKCCNIRNTKAGLKRLYKFEALDEIAVLLAMLTGSDFFYLNPSIGSRLCAAFIELITDRFWQSFGKPMLVVIRSRALDETGNQIEGLTDMEIKAATKFWKTIKEKYFEQEAFPSLGRWTIWRHVVRDLAWHEQALFIKYISRHSKELDVTDLIQGERIYKRVRARFYRAM